MMVHLQRQTVSTIRATTISTVPPVGCTRLGFLDILERIYFFYTVGTLNKATFVLFDLKSENEQKRQTILIRFCLV